MTTPKRLVQSGSPLERRLLLAARAETPRAGAEDAALAVLGVGAALPASSPGAAACGKALGVKLAFAPAVFSVITATSGVAMVAWALRSPSPAPPAPPARAPVALVATSVPAPMPPPAEAATQVAAPVPAAQPLRPTPVRAARPSRGADLSSEVTLVQRAAQALAAGDASAALASLDEVHARCKTPLLSEEAGLLRARALAMQGRASEAQRLARQLLDANPHGVLAKQFGAIAAVDAAR